MSQVLYILRVFFYTVYKDDDVFVAQVGQGFGGIVIGYTRDLVQHLSRIIASLAHVLGDTIHVLVRVMENTVTDNNHLGKGSCLNVLLLHPFVLLSIYSRRQETKA